MSPAVKSDFKVVVSDSHSTLTAARLQEALNELHGQGVPDWAKVLVNTQPGGPDATGWAVIAKWDPADEPSKKSVEIHVEINEDRVSPRSTFRYPTRKVQDSPQA